MRIVSEALPPATGGALAPARKPAVTLLCHCLGITEEAVRGHIETSSRPTVDSVTRLTGAGSGCTGCRKRIQRLLDGKPAACGRFGPCDHCGNCRAICGCDADPAPVLCRSHCAPSNDALR